MKNENYTHLDDRTILVHHTEQLPALQTHPEPVRPPVKRLTREQVKKKFGGWTDEQMNIALQQPGFPPVIQRLNPAGFFGATPVWDSAALDCWAAGVRDQIATLQRLVGVE